MKTKGYAAVKRAFLLGIVLISLSSYSFATCSKSNQKWLSGYGQGILEFSITNEQGSKLIVSCDVGFSDTGEMSSVALDIGEGNSYTPEFSKVNIVINSTSHELPTNFEDKTSYKKWNDFILSLQHANYFSVYISGNLEGEFSPDVNNSREFVTQINRCLLKN
ncbi:hypothetical protein [Vibrio sp. TBV020]|uniref:hypothetical protein n=1 Tax=Vibrio sp. TBV020 TaxID=3137398 RepID=UPI0038CD3A5E